MANRALRSTKLSARAAYARNAAEENSNKRGRGRPRLNPVSSSAELSKTTSKGKSVLRKRKRSSGVAAKVETNSSEADCSSEGEEQTSDDENKEQDIDEDSEIEENNSSNEEISASEEESDVEMLNNTLPKSETASISVKSTGDEDDENEIRYSLPNTKLINLSKQESAKNDKTDKKKKRPSPQKSLGSSERKLKGPHQISSSSPKPNLKNQKISAVKKEPIQDEENTVSPIDKKRVKSYDNSSFSPNKSVDGSKDNQVSKRILKEIIKKYETLKRQYKSKSEDSDESQNESNPAKKRKVDEIIQDKWNTKYSFSKRYKAVSTRFSVGKLDSENCLYSPVFAGRTRTSRCGNIAADEAFRWLLNPLEPDEFFLNIFEKMPHHINRKKYSYYKELFTCDNLNTMLKENDLLYGVHIDVLKYENGERKPVEAVGKAYNSNVWDDFKQGYSVRIRNPQAYNKNIWNICSLLQEYFSSGVGCNIYLTPPSSQGFPPHYDDIDAFIVQVEGAKIWKVYPPRNPNEELARYSSTDFQESEVGQPMHEIVLKPGDMLYIPRGYIHQAHTGDLEHSMHLTFSTNQLNTWGDLMLQASQKAMERAILNEVEFRKSVPRDFMDCAGSTFSGDDFKKSAFLHQMKMLGKVALNYVDPNEAVDMHALRFIRCSLPPVFSKVERQCSIHGNGTHWQNGEIISKSPLDLNTQIRLIRKRNLRLVIDESGPKLYHSLENKRDPSHPDSDTQEEVYVDFDMAGVEPFTYLLKAHSRYVSVSDLPIEDFESQIAFATSLYENGLLMTKEPLKDFKEAEWNTLNDNNVSMKKEKSFLNF